MNEVLVWMMMMKEDQSMGGTRISGKEKVRRVERVERCREYLQIAKLGSWFEEGGGWGVGSRRDLLMIVVE